jgi:hypothetical protein
MADWKLPGKDDHVCVIVPPTHWYEFQLLLYAHDVYLRSLHTMRLVRWLEQTCRTVTMIDNLSDPEARLALAPSGLGEGRIGADLRQGRFGLDADELARRIVDAGEPSQIWITTMFPYDREEIEDTIRICKKVRPKTTVVVGGAFATLLPELTAKLGADIVHQGLLDPAEDVATVRLGTIGMVCVSRGCPGRCAFCANHRLENRSWMGEHDELLRAIESLVDSGVSLLDLYSLNFFAPSRAERAERLFEAIAEYDVRTLLWTGLDPKHLTSRRARLLREAGCIDILVPLQTLDRDLVAKWGRADTLELYGDAISMLCDAGFDPLEIGSDMLIGHPDQSLEECVRTACYIWSKGLTPLMFPYTFVPGTRDFQTYGHLVDGFDMQQWFPYIFPFAQSERHRRDWQQLAILSRVSPPFLERALGYLDPDSPVKDLIERALAKCGFDFPQHEVTAPLSGLRSGYHTFLSHPWETALHLVLHNHASQAAELLPLCRRVRVCAPKYLEIPRRLLLRGFEEQAREFAQEAAWSLPRDLRKRVVKGIAHDESLYETFSTVAKDVSSVLEGDGLKVFCDRWRSMMTREQLFDHR